MGREPDSLENDAGRWFESDLESCCESPEAGMGPYSLDDKTSGKYKGSPEGTLRESLPSENEGRIVSRLPPHSWEDGLCEGLLSLGALATQVSRLLPENGSNTDCPKRIEDIGRRIGVRRAFCGSSCGATLSSASSFVPSSSSASLKPLSISSCESRKARKAPP